MLLLSFIKLKMNTFAIFVDGEERYEEMKVGTAENSCRGKSKALSGKRNPFSSQKYGKGNNSALEPMEKV